MSCVIHYEGTYKYSEAKSVTDVMIKQICEAKVKHEELEDEHCVQCSTVPDTLSDKHMVHTQPCYTKFTRILRGNKSKASKVEGCCRQQTTRSSTSISTHRLQLSSPDNLSASNSLLPMVSPERVSSRLSSQSPVPRFKDNLYPKECSVCKKYRITVHGDEQIPITCVTDTAAKSIKRGAKEKEEYKDLYFQIESEDLCAREFKYHHKCYRKVTKHISSTDTTNLDDNRIESKNKKTLENVVNYIDEIVICQNQAVSMQTILRIYNEKCDELSSDAIRQARKRLKTKLQVYYGKKLLFVAPNESTTEVVINSDTISEHVSPKDDNDSRIISVARYLRNVIQQYCASLPALNWPPSIEDLLANERQPPACVTLFLKNVLKHPDHSMSSDITRLVESYSADLIHGVSKGQVLTAKHYLLALALHSLTGQKNVVQLTSRLGNCMTYDKVMDVETAQAQKAQHLEEHSSYLPLKPINEHSSVITVFWVDNFDKNVEREGGGGAINMTTMMAFQEVSDECVAVRDNINIEKTRTRQLNIATQSETNVVIRNGGKPEPNNTKFSTFVQVRPEEAKAEQKLYMLKYFTWLYLRHTNSFSQNHPTFSGWLVKLNTRKARKLSKTVETYLPPLSTKVTEPNTIYKYMTYLQRLAKEANMDYVNITLDVGAAINAYKLSWSFGDKFKNIVIHLGDFHFLKENFKVIGSLVSCSGFEDVIFQASVCTSGSLNGLLSGSHYNRAWIVHSCMSEGLERLLLKRFLTELKPKIPDDLKEASCDDADLINDAVVNSTEKISDEYESFKANVRNGSLGKTAQFWMLYIDTMNMQHMAHTAVQENDFDLRRVSWKSFLPYYFAFNLHNYARYASYYVEVLDCIDGLYPGLRQTLSQSGLSVQAQERYAVRTAIDQRGEQTINRDAKRSGGISQFAAKEANVMKWTLNRSEAAANVAALYEMTALTESHTIYKHLRPTQILISEKRVQKIQEVLETEFINPFSLNIDTSKLINLSSGVSLDDENADAILSVLRNGKAQSEEFKEKRLRNQDVKFHDAIKKNSIHSFSNTKKKTTVTCNGKAKSLEVNRDILGSLVSYSLKTGKAIDFEKALQFPLSPIPLSICHADGTRRETSKSKLKDILMKGVVFETGEGVVQQRDAVVIPMMDLINTFTAIPETYMQFCDKFVRSLPKNYDRIDIVADTYRDDSVKGLERLARGEAEPIHIASLSSKIPEFSRILRSGKNKTRLVELLVEYIDKTRAKVMNILRCRKIVISTLNSCTVVTHAGTTIDESLQSTQEEADTKVILHCLNILSSIPTSMVTLRCHSGDTDIFILAVALLNCFRDRVVYDDHHGKSRKVFPLKDVDIEDDIIDALIGFHAFTGNDYISSFFRKGKETCYKILLANPKFKSVFANLGTLWEVDDSLFSNLQEFVCKLYGSSSKHINKLRYNLFNQKYNRENKSIDMSVIPPCSSTLKLHSRRANFVSGIWKRSSMQHISEPSIALHGWFPNGNVMWIEDAFPSEVIDILVDEEYHEDDVYGNEADSDIED